VKRLVCVSNRISLPRRGATPGGLAVGVLAALRHTGGVWFGWSGETSEVPAEQPETATRGNIRFATIDLQPALFDAYYNGYCNGTLWPLFHYFRTGSPTNSGSTTLTRQSMRSLPASC